MLLGWLGPLPLLLSRVLELVLVFWMELVPSRGRELVLCPDTARAEEIVTAAAAEVAGGTGLPDPEPGAESSDSRASTWASGTELRRP